MRFQFQQIKYKEYNLKDTHEPNLPPKRQK